ncbi:MurR/RpiR family transcriptional regulator [Paraburkholderia caballeronis]|uniref:MurR/RpiR family transcriptional regulator n=1 Tax=Paraburkholderia caballeronis TaxID=416943 RepID=UPI001066E9AC|nr:MurR/RpiR family transcriptional regulator [Paraburkholderia caballeronis]TDV07199.1 RpiR family transcriptional regulator [Paraburkholderia caballeronis]TDV11343.1 RpiR family transcriptional regulator [Paraburkholderia caballeronis]TDV22528.1 RpiR family transcriptional regulator [Paraburkholderia caballeronis]
MHDTSTPFAQAVEARFAELTPTAKRIASYMLANLERIGLETADRIAQQTGTSGISVGRFLRHVGYRNLDDLKRELHDIHPRPWRRSNATPGDATARPGIAFAHSLDLELDAIRDAYALANTPAFTRIAERIAHADAVYLPALPSTRGLVNAFYRDLDYVRAHVFHPESATGSFADALNTAFASPYLIVADVRADSPVARRYCEAAARRQLPFALVTDLYNPWARDFPCDLLQVRTDVGQFRDSLAPLACVFNLLITSVVERLGPALDARLARHRELQRELGPLDPPSRPRGTAPATR